MNKKAKSVKVVNNIKVYFIFNGNVCLTRESAIHTKEESKK